MKKFLTFYFALFICGSISASNYYPGCIITQAGDTIRGFIDFRTDKVNAKRCTFKQTENSQAVVYSPNDISGYQIDDYKYYTSRDITLTGITKKVFLEFMVKGIVNLYYYEEEGQAYYFFEKQGGTMEMVTKRPDEIKDDYVKVDNKYDGMVRYIFNDCPAIANRSGAMAFNQENMINVAKIYHADVCKTGEECIVFENKNPDDDGIRILFSVYAGMQLSSYKFADYYNINGYYPYYGKEAESYSNLSPVIGGKIGFVNPRASKSFGILVDIAFSQFKGVEDLSKHYRVDYSSYVAMFKLGVKYTYPKYKIRPSVEIGPAFAALINSSSEIILHDIPGRQDEPIEYTLRQRYIGAYAGIGIDYVLNKNTAFFLRLSYDAYIGGDATQETGKDNIKMPQLVFGYTF